MKLIVIDYDAGNLRSVETALRHLGYPYTVTADPDEVTRADKILVPGVGEARAAMAVLREHGLDVALRSFHRSGKPMLGICIGSQIILDRSEENNTPCLGLMSGTARKFPERKGLKVPHMGWNTVTWEGATAGIAEWLFKGIPRESSFYFVHSYYPEPERRKDIVARCEYGVDFAAVLGSENLIATQFHPEKSGEVGLRLLKNFLEE